MCHDYLRSEIDRRKKYQSYLNKISHSIRQSGPSFSRIIDIVLKYEKEENHLYRHKQGGAALSQADYLKKKMHAIDIKIKRLKKANPSSKELFDLYFQMGKLTSEYELIKRVPKYKD
jgi:hypothetical protein